MSESLVNIGSGNGLLPDGTKPLPAGLALDLEPYGMHCKHGIINIFASISKIMLMVLCYGECWPEPMLTLWHSFQGMLTWILNISISKLFLTFKYLTSQPHLPGDNESFSMPLNWLEHMVYHRHLSNWARKEVYTTIFNKSVVPLSYLEIHLQRKQVLISI